MTNDGAVVPHLTVAIVSSHCLIWHGLHQILDGADAFRIDVHPDRRITPELLLPERRPDLFIVDEESQHDVIRTIKQIRESALTSKIVLLCGLHGRDSLLEACACGLDGVVLKIQPPEVVLAVIEAIYAHRLSPVDVKRGRVEEKRPGDSFSKTMEFEPQPVTWPETLTEREREIIPLMEEGLSNKEIADRLLISDSTVRHHLTSIYEKVGVSDRQKLLIQARSRP